MGDDQAASAKTVAEEEEPRLVRRVIGMVQQAGALVDKNAAGLFKRDAVPGEVCEGLAVTPGNSILPIA